MSLCDTFKHLWKTNEYNNIGWLLLMLLLKKDDLRDLNSQLNLLSDLKTSPCALKETLNSCSRSAEIAGNLIQNLILRLDKLQCKLDSQAGKVSTIKVRALVGKEWDPISWDGDVWGDSEEIDPCILMTPIFFFTSGKVLLTPGRSVPWKKYEVKIWLFLTEPEEKEKEGRGEEEEERI